MSLFDELMARFKSQPEVLPQNVTEGIAKLKGEAPDISSTSIGMMGGIAQHLLPGAEGWTSPMGGISLNPEMMKGKSADEVGDTLLHELTHVHQAKQRGVIGQVLATLMDKLPYGQKPDELEAFQSEADRRTRMGRAPIFGTPNFADAGQATRGDINLYHRNR